MVQVDLHVAGPPDTARDIARDVLVEHFGARALHGDRFTLQLGQFYTVYAPYMQAVGHLQTDAKGVQLQARVEVAPAHRALYAAAILGFFGYGLWILIQTGSFLLGSFGIAFGGTALVVVLYQESRRSEDLAAERMERLVQEIQGLVDICNDEQVAYNPKARTEWITE